MNKTNLSAKFCVFVTLLFSVSIFFVSVIGGGAQLERLYNLLLACVLFTFVFLFFIAISLAIYNSETKRP